MTRQKVYLREHPLRSNDSYKQSQSTSPTLTTNIVSFPQQTTTLNSKNSQNLEAINQFNPL